MKKFFIIGIVASGKTTLAKRLSEKINVPWYELDCIVHHKTETDRYKRTPEQQVEVIEEIDKNESWIFEGTYRQSYHCLLDMADTIIFLDPPLWKRKQRIFIRFLKQQFGLEMCHYKSDIGMLKKMYKWTSDFERERDGFEFLLESYNHKLIRLSDSGNLDFTK
jgi:adenylate kinase family enzyme